VSTDQAHSTGDVLGVTVAPTGERHPTRVLADDADAGGGFLDALALDTLALLEVRWREVAKVISARFPESDLGDVAPEELSALPGVQEVLGLHEVGELAGSGEWDHVVVDCASTADALRMLTLPATFGLYLERAWPRHRRLSMTEDDARWADVVVTMGCGDECPYIPGRRYVDASDVTGSVEKEKEKPKEEAKPEVAKAETTAAPTEAPATVSASERAILERLQARRQELEARAREIDIRESLLKAAEKRAEGRVEEMKAIESRITGAAAQKADEDAARFKGIITMYEGMKPKDAAKVFDRLEMPVLFEIASHIAPRKMADIMGQMQPEVAERLTVEMARRAGGDKSGSDADLPKIDIPVLVLHGTADRILPIEACGPRTAELIPGSEFVPIEGAGHGLCWTHADMVNAELLRFFK